MHIIPQNQQNIQANLLRIGQQLPNSQKTMDANRTELSQTQRDAFIFYDLGFNVFPQPIAKKGGFSWRSLQFSRLVRNHHKYGLQVLFTGTCNLAIMCGRTSDNLFVIDCETPEALHHNIAQLRKKQIPLWVVKTARGGHIYLRSQSGEVKNIGSGIIKDAEIKGNRSYVLAPPSVHPSGTRYTWAHREGRKPPTIDPKTIDWIKDVKSKSITIAIQQSRSPKKVSQYNQNSELSRATRSYLNGGHSVPEGERNNSLFKAACDLAGNHRSKKEAESLLISVALTSGLPESEVRATINSAYSRKRFPAKRNQHGNTHSKTKDWQKALLHTQTKTWEGRTAGSQRAILLALIERAKLSSNEQGIFRASIREISTLARTGTATTQRIIKQFQKDDLIIKCGRDQSSYASLWKFGKKVQEDSKQSKVDTLKSPPYWKMNSVSIFSLPDVVERGALGYNGLVVYRALMSIGEPLMPKLLAERTGLKVHQVKYALKKLQKYALVLRGDGGWTAVEKTDAELDGEVAKQVGVFGKGEARRERFMLERQVFASQKMLESRLRYEPAEDRIAYAKYMVDLAAWRQDFSDARLSFDEGTSDSHAEKPETQTAIPRENSSRLPQASEQNEPDKILVAIT